MSPKRVVPLLARWKGRLAGLLLIIGLSDPSTYECVKIFLNMGVTLDGDGG